MQGIKSCYIAKTISLEIAQGTLLDHGSPKQLLEAHTEKNMAVLPCQDQLHQGLVRETEPLHVPGRLSGPMAFQSCYGFQIQWGVWAIWSQKESTKEISTDCKLIMLSNHKFMWSRTACEEWGMGWLRSLFRRNRIIQVTLARKSPPHAHELEGISI